MPITDWPIADRPREKLLNLGEQFLTDSELIAILIKTGIPGKTALDLAKELLQEYGSLKKLFGLMPKTLMNKPGLGKAKYTVLKAALELGKRYREENILIGQTLNHCDRVKEFLKERLEDHGNEVFACIFMDNHFRLICFEELFHGTIHSAQIYPREIVKRGLFHNAAKLILAHNHPSGMASPSKEDGDTTHWIKQTLALVDIDVVDHIIVGRGQYFSFAEAGLL